MIKPDAVSAGRTDAILAQLRDNGFLVVGRKTETLTADRAKAFYAEHVGKPFYADLVKFMTSGPVEALVLERMNAITAWRLLQVCVPPPRPLRYLGLLCSLCERACVACARVRQGPTNTAVAKSDYPGTVRGRFATDGTRNATHGSDSSASADREIAFWCAPHVCVCACRVSWVLSAFLRAYLLTPRAVRLPGSRRASRLRTRSRSSSLAPPRRTGTRFGGC